MAMRSSRPKKNIHSKQKKKQLSITLFIKTNRQGRIGILVVIVLPLVVFVVLWKNF